MSEISASVNPPRVPQVNLIPPEVAQRRSQGRTRFLILIAFILFLAMLAGAWFLVYTSRVEAENRLQEELDRRPILLAELATYDYLPELEAKLENSRQARMWAGASDIIWADFLMEVNRAFPEDTGLVTLTIAAGSPMGVAAGDGTPFAQEDMGGINFEFVVLEPIVASDVIEALDDIPGLHQTYVTVTAIEAVEEADLAYWRVEGSSRITFNALSGRTVTEQTTLPPGMEIEVPDSDTEEGDGA